MVTVKFKRLHPDAKIPTMATPESGGYDVYAARVLCLETNRTEILTGFALEIPPGYRAILVPRSSITKTSWILQNSPGLGDSDYRGEYKFVFIYIEGVVNNSINTNSVHYPFKKGDRIGQLYLEKVIPINFVEVDELSSTERGEGGFGSTGK